MIKYEGVPTTSRLGLNISLMDKVTRPSEFFDRDGVYSCERDVVAVEGLDWCDLGQPTF